MSSMIKIALGLSIMFLLSACGGGSSGTSDEVTVVSGGGGGDESEEPNPTLSVTSISLATDRTAVRSNNSDTATITATVLDSSNAVVEGATVNFSATGGQLSSSEVISDAQGRAVVEFSSGTADPSNRTVTVSAQTQGVSAVRIPIQITGSSLTIQSDGGSLLKLGGAPGSDSATLTILAETVSGAPVHSANLNLEVAGTGGNPGAASLSTTSGVTDVNGELTSVLTATSQGEVTVTATGLGVTTTQVFDIQDNATAFQINNPNPETLAIGGNLTIEVNAPTQTNVTFATSLGVWDGGARSLITKNVAGGVVSAVLSSADSGGAATVQVFDAADPSVTDSITVLISAPSDAAAELDLQSDLRTLPRSQDGNVFEAELTARVLSVGLQPVSGAPVVFSISEATGGGETVDPVYTITGTDGKATSTFTSGSISSDANGVTVTATAYDSDSNPLVSDSINIVIGGEAGSVVIGHGTVIQSNESETAYELPMAVLVADANGNAVSGAVVTLSAWPEQYSTGWWLPTENASEECVAITTATFPNEDRNKNLRLDPGEDVPYTVAYLATEDPPGSEVYSEDLNRNGVLDVSGQIAATGFLTISVGEDLNGNGQIDQFSIDGVLTPANSAAGALPATVTTGPDGLADFNLVYLKQDAHWIVNQIRASTQVLGTETTGVLRFRLPVSREDAKACLVIDSPFNPN